MFVNFVCSFPGCNRHPAGTVFLSKVKCEKRTCSTTKPQANGEGCGVVDIQLTPEQEAQGCEVKQVQVSRRVRYPDCCEKYVDCPSQAY
ncbi:hypothetical protein EB796_021336 [Bugula neritina]|uniref:Uncharacterized protein n=1 Tax=Bugula neritina TaxID=10212 RepID=A0A7J7J3T1_BUGNE|nr:hypothetical protein EB796_021336 [Bugula neritina]